MPRQYMQPQPGLFVGQSARQDMAQARARADQERIRQQRLQGFQYTGQARQAARTQREAQRAAQQQMAMASRERDADRQFQMQRDAFGARRDYAMQERRIQSAAEQAQFGRDFEREQQETRFGQQQDLAMQEQDYRLQQLDIAAQDQFLSAEQQAEIQRERDMLVSDMQRDAAREGRFEQFAYGQMAAEEAARRPLSVAERQRLRFGDELSARQQGRAARYREEEQGRAAKIATDQAYLQHGFRRQDAEYENEAKLLFFDLNADEQARIRAENQDAANMFADDNVRRDIYAAREKEKIQRDSARAREDRKADEAAQQLKDSDMFREIDLIENNDKLSPAEKDRRTAEIISKYDAMDNRRWRSPTPSDRMRNATWTDSRGNLLNVDKFGNVNMAVPAPPAPINIGGKPLNNNETVVVDGTTWMNFGGKPVSLGETQGSRSLSLYRQNLVRELFSKRTIKLPFNQGTREEDKYTEAERNEILRANGIDIPESNKEKFLKALQEIEQGSGPQMSNNEAQDTIEYLNNRYGRPGEDGSTDPSKWDDQDVLDWKRAQKALGRLTPKVRKDLQER